MYHFLDRQQHIAAKQDDERRLIPAEDMDSRLHPVWPWNKSKKNNTIKNLTRNKLYTAR